MLLSTRPTQIQTRAKPGLAHWQIQGRASDHLNLLRALAALAVLLNHLKLYFLVDYADLQNPNLLVKALYFVCGFGHSAVIIFFVLSGLFISSSVFKAYQSRRWSWKNYAIARLVRLWLVLWPALLIGAVWDRLSMWWFGQASVYSQFAFYDNTTRFSLQQRFSLPTGLGNAFFLQEIAVPTFGSNGVLWSLSYEFWYYLLLPLGLVIFWPSSHWRTRLVAGLSGVILLIFLGSNIALYFLIWLLGTVVAVAPRLPFLAKSRALRRGLLLLAAGTMAGWLAFIRISDPADRGTFPSDFVLGLATALLIYAVLSTQCQPEGQDYISTQLQPAGNVLSLLGSTYSSLTSGLAGFSYTLYLVHLPLLFFLKLWLLPAQQWQPTPAHLGLVAIILGGVLVYAYFFSRLTEAQTEKVRLFLVKKLA